MSLLNLVSSIITAIKPPAPLPVQTYKFSAFKGSDILGGANTMSIGRSFVMPVVATASLSVADDDAKLSGDIVRNERGNDQTAQTANITYNNAPVATNVKVYAEKYYLLKGNDGKTYKLLEIELKGTAQLGNDTKDYYSFIGAVPPAGVKLTVLGFANSGDVKYSDLGAGPTDIDPLFGAGTTTGTVTEIADGATGENTATLTATGTIAFTDNVGDSHTVLVAPQGGGYLGNLVASISNSATSDGAGAVTWTYTVLDSAVDYLKENEQLSQSYTLTLKDASGDVSTKTITITLKGTNDKPTAVADTNGADAVTEAGVNPGTTSFPGDASAAGNVLTNDTDPDASDSKTVAGVQAGTAAGPLSSGVGATITGVYGKLTLLANGNWTYALDNSDADTNALVQGQAATDTFTYTMKDGSGATSTTTLKIALTGTNDLAVIGGVSTGSVTEDATSPNLSTSGALTIADPDAGQSSFVAQAATAGSNGYGTFTLNSSGTWTYTASNGNAAIQDLAVDETLTDSFTAVSSDGTASKIVTVTIKGNNDVVYTVNDDVDPTATKGGAGTELFVGSGIPDNGFGLVNQTDVGVELGLQVIYRQGPTVLSTDANGYGDGELHFTVNDGFQSTENGSFANSATRAAWSFNYSIATGLDGEAGNLDSYTFKMLIDVDPTAGTSYRTFVLEPGGTGSSGHQWRDQDSGVAFIADDSGNANVTQNSQNFGFAFYQSFLTSAYGPGNGFDGPAEFDIILEASRGANVLATNHIVVDVVESNDAPTAVNDTASVKEDVTLTASGNVLTNDTDPNFNDTKTVTNPGTYAGNYGTLTLNADGTYGYALNNGAANVQALGASETAPDTFSYTMLDRDGATSSATLTVTVNGTNDAPVAVDDSFTTETAMPVSGNVLADNGPGDAGDRDVDGDTLSVSLSDDVDNGTLVLNADGTFTYTPNALFSGTDGFTYQVSDGNGGTDTAVVTIAVEASANPGQVLTIDETGAIVDAFTTIQAAIDSMDAGADIGWTVLVGAGVYSEQVVVDGFTDLTIKADGAVSVTAPATLVQYGTSASGSELFSIISVEDSTNVQIEGIEVNGGGNTTGVSGTDPDFVGVSYRNSSGGLTDVDVTGIRDPYEPGTTADGFPIVSGLQRGVGVRADNDAPAVGDPLLKFTMTGGSITDFQKNATVFEYADLDVSGVTITGGGAQPIIAQNGIQAANSTGSIEGNTITEIGYAGPAFAYSGSILLFDNVDLGVIGNTIAGTNDATADAKVVAVFVIGGSGGEISGNTIEQVDTGIGVYGVIASTGIDIHDNTVSDLDPTDPFYAGVDHQPDGGLATVFNVEGTEQHDIFSGGTSADTFTGLGGDDVVLIADGADHAAGEVIDGGGGTDSIAFTSGTASDELVLQPGVTNVENIYIGGYNGGSSFDTSGTTALDLDASAGDSVLASIFGNDGNNIIVGTEFGTTIYGHGGDDTVTGNGGDDVIYGGDAALTDDSDADTATYADALQASDFSYDAGTGQWTVATDTEGTDKLKGIEKVIDGAGNVFLLVDLDPAGGFASIQAAIEAASGGETILIAPGTYTETSQYVPGDFQGLYINKPNLTLQGFSSDDGSVISNATDAKDYGPTVIAGAQNQFGANHWVDIDGDGITIQGVHLQAGPETDNKVLEIWADNVTVQHNFIDAYDSGGTYTYAAAVYLNDNGPTADWITAYSINDNILNEGIIVANGVGEANDPEPAANQTIVDNQFIGTFDPLTGEGRYDTVALNGAGQPWLTEAVQIPTISGNTLENNTTPFILRGSATEPADLPTAGQVQDILDANGDENLSYAYVVDTTSGELVTALRNPGPNEYHNFAVTNTIDTLNLALDTSPDNVHGGQREYIHAGDTLVVQSGASGALNSEIMVQDLTVRATVNSADLNLTLATNFADGTPISGGGVSNLALADYALGSGADVDVTGNLLANAITGNSGDNTLRGLGGNDSLTGGAGDDIFVFGLPEASDGIADLDVVIGYGNGNDTIDLVDGITAESITDQLGYVEITLSGLDGDKIRVTGVTSGDLLIV